MAHRFTGFTGVVVAIALLLATGARGDPVVGFGQIAINGSPNGVGFVDVAITPTNNSGIGYLNVAVDWDSDGQLNTSEWVVFNMVIPLHPDWFGGHSATFSASFDLSSITLSSQSYTVYASFDMSARSPEDFTSLQANLSVSFSTYDIGNLIEGDGVSEDLLAGLGGGTGSGLSPYTGDANSPLSAQQTKPPKDPYVRHDIPGIKQGPGECVPVSIAQSLFWLEKQHPDALRGKLPGQNDLIQQLKQAMGTTAVGTRNSNIEPGKQKVLKNLGLDKIIVTKKGGDEKTGHGTFEFVKEELQKGEDVELALRIPGKPGHMVTVAGWAEDSSGKWLYFKDPVTGGGTIDAYKLAGTKVQYYKYARDAYLSFALSESVIPEPGTLALFSIGVLAPALAALKRSAKRRE